MRYMKKTLVRGPSSERSRNFHLMLACTPLEVSSVVFVCSLRAFKGPRESILKIVLMGAIYLHIIIFQDGMRSEFKYMAQFF